MSFTNAPVTRTLVLGLVSLSIAVSLLDAKHYFYIVVDTHIFRYRQPWRALIYQLCYTNSSELLFASMTLYNMRSIERLWGSRKYATFIATTALLTAVIPPVLLVAVFRPLTFGVFNYLPAGPTPIIFAILVQYHAIIPHVYKYRLALSPTATTTATTGSERESARSEPGGAGGGLTFSDKSYRYLLAVQLALFQWPGSILGAVVGCAVGYAWRNDLLPGALTGWRVPGWLVGIRGQRKSAEFDGLRRRLEGETAPASSGTASGLQTASGGSGGGSYESSRRRARDSG